MDAEAKCGVHPKVTWKRPEPKEEPKPAPTSSPMPKPEPKAEPQMEPQAWGCHRYADGQDDAWCQSAGTKGGFEYHWVGPAADMCDECWCCKREAADESAGASDAAKVSLAAQPEAICTAHPKCAALDNDCCPTKDGMYLDCCEQQGGDDDKNHFMFLKRFLQQGRLEGGPGLSACSLTALVAISALIGSAAVRTVSHRFRPRPLEQCCHSRPQVRRPAIQQLDVQRWDEDHARRMDAYEADLLPDVEYIE